MFRTLTLILSATLAAACASRGEVQYATVAATPELVEIGPGVSVVVDAGEPVFFANNAYWLHRDNTWYRSETTSGTWMRIATPPPALTSIADPGAYAHFTRERTTRTTQTLPQRAPADVPYPNPRPPQQQPPIVPDDPGTVDRVPAAPTSPEPGDVDMVDPQAHAPITSDDDLGRPDRIRDR